MMAELPMAHSCPACGYPRDGGTCAHCQGEVVDVVDSRVIRSGTGFFLFDIVGGFVEVFHAGLLLVTRPEFSRTYLLAMGLNLVAVPALGVGLWFGFDALFGWLLAGDWGWLDFLHTAAVWIAPVFAFLLTLLGVYLLLPVLLETVLGPFLDPIGAATEAAILGRAPPPSPLGTWQAILVSARASVHVLTRQLLLLVLVLAFAWTGTGLVVGFVGAAWLSALVWFEAPAVRRGLDLGQRRALLRRNWARALGLGLGFQVGVLVPVFNILLLAPATTIAAARLYFRFDKVSGAK